MTCSPLSFSEIALCSVLCTFASSPPPDALARQWILIGKIAEGVEKPEEAFFLLAAGVDGGQGWLWSKAVPSQELEPLIARCFEQHGFIA